MSTRGVLSALAVVLLLVSGCGGGETAGPPPVSGDGNYQWGQVHRAAVDVSAGAPAAFTTSEEGAFPPETEGWRSVVVLTNHGRHPFSVSSLRPAAAADGAGQREVIDPRNGCNGWATSQPVLPGETRGITGCWTGGDSARSLTLTSLDGATSATFSG